MLEAVVHMVAVRVVVCVVAVLPLAVFGGVAVFVGLARGYSLRGRVDRTIQGD